MRITLTDEQAEAIGERIDDLLSDTEDWDGDDESFAKAVEFWLTILKRLKQTNLEKQIRFNYKHVEGIM